MDYTTLCSSYPWDDLLGDIHKREGITHLRVEGKGDKLRYLPRTLWPSD